MADYTTYKLDLKNAPRRRDQRNLPDQRAERGEQLLPELGYPSSVTYS
jgi:hypothetical protein